MRSCLLLLTSFLPVLLGAQSPQYLHYGLSDGLPSNLVYCIEQDGHGMIWMGTDNGLSRFDGKQFHNFQTSDGIPDPEVLNLKTDLNGRLWVSCFRKNACYYANGQFRMADNDSTLAQIQFTSAINDLFIDSTLGIWFTGMDRTVYQYNEDKVRLYLLDHPVHKIGKIGNDILAFSRACISLFHLESGKVDTLFDLYKHFDKTYRLGGLGVSGNRILYATSMGYWLFEWDGKRLTMIDQKDFPNGNVFVDHQGRFWVGTNTVGAICFDNLNRTLTQPKYYLKDQKITHIFQDDQESFWFGTTGNGVFVLPFNHSYKITKAEGIPLNNITAIFRTDGGLLLAGDEEGNLLQIRQDKIQTTLLVPGIGYNRIRHIHPLNDTSQLIVADFGVFEISAGTTRQITDRISTKAAVSKGGRIWVGASTIFESVDLKSLQSQIINRRRVTALSQSPDGFIWMTGVDGLYSSLDSFQSNQIERFSDLNCRFTAVEPNGDHELLLGTSDAGLFRAHIRDGTLRSVQPLPFSDSKNKPQIRAIHRSEDGRIWLATPEGVYWLSPDGRQGRISIYQGLIDNDVNEIWVGQDTLWAATRYGIGIIPLHVHQKQNQFDVYFTTLHYRLNRQVESIDLYANPLQDQMVILPKNAGMVEISMAALEYTGGGGEYYIEETEHLLPWHHWTFHNLSKAMSWRKKTPNQAQYSPASGINMGANPAPGIYHFAVRAKTQRGDPSRNSANLSIYIPPQWYETVWFWIGLLLLIVAAVWRFLHTYTRVRALDSAVSNLQLKALQAQINPHFLGNSINAIQQFFYPPEPARASEYVGILTDLLRKTMLFSEYHFIPFREELAYDREYLQLIELRYGEQFRFEVCGWEHIPPETPFPGMMLQPLLENATIHGLAPEGTSEIKVCFSFEEGKLLCRITDNGIGITAAQSRPKTSNRKSKGLQMVYQKIGTLNRLYHIHLQLTINDRTDGSGTIAELCFRPKNIPKEKTLSTPPMLNDHENQSLYH